VAYSGLTSGTYSYTYDNNRFLSRIGFVDSGGTSVSIPLSRDKDGLITGYGDFGIQRDGILGRPVSIQDKGAGIHTLQISYTFDSLGRLSGRTHTVNGIQIYGLNLTRDNTGRISRKTDGSAFDYVYDRDGQLKEARKDTVLVEQYAYDSNANRTSTLIATAQYDIQDRITTQGGTTYQHNADGFMTLRGTQALNYSVFGELLQTVSGGVTVEYAHDGYGRRVGRKENSGNWYQYFYGDPYNENFVTTARDPNGVLSIYHYDDFGHLFAFQRGGAWYYVATDQVGSPRVVSDTSGNVVKAIEYDAFGVVVSDSASGFDLPFGFAGGIKDSTTGLVRFGARDYDPVIGRWTARDPILYESGQANLYGYAGNDPVGAVDPSGLDTFYWTDLSYEREYFSKPPYNAREARLSEESFEKTRAFLNIKKVQRDPKCLNTIPMPYRIHMVKYWGFKDPGVDAFLKRMEEKQKRIENMKPPQYYPEVEDVGVTASRG
jgi:RHS repeat-associated protein